MSDQQLLPILQSSGFLSSPERIAELIESMDVELAREDVNEFNRLCFTDERGDPWTIEEPHREWQALIPQYGTPCRVLIISPHSSGKSSELSIGRVLWEIGKHPNIRIRVLCADAELAESFIQELKTHLMYNPMLKKIFPHLEPSQPWTKNVLTVRRPVIMKDPTVQAESILGGSTGGRCVTSDSVIITSDGLVRADAVKVHQRVLAMDGKYHRVRAVKAREHDGEVVVIDPQGVPFPVRVTPEHPVLVWRKDATGLPAVQWVESGKIIKTDMLVFPRPMYGTTHRFVHNRVKQKQFYELLSYDETWYLLGLFVGDGWRSKDNGHCRRINIGLNASVDVKVLSKAKRAGKKIGASVTATRRDNMVTLHITHELFAELCKLFGDGAHDKRIPPWVERASLSRQASFVSGFFDADGCETALGKVNFVSCNPSLLNSIQLIVAAWGLWLSHLHHRREGDVEFKGRTVHQKDLYSLDTSHPLMREMLQLKALPPRQRIATSDYGWWTAREFMFIPIASIQRESFSGQVYDFEVVDAHCFCAPGITLHNSDLLLADDVCTLRNTIQQPKFMPQVISAFKNVWLNTLSPQGRAVVVNTPWHKRDLTSNLENDPEWTKWRKPAVDPETGMPLLRKYTPTFLRGKRKELGPRFYARGFLLQAIDDSERTFPDDTIKKDTTLRWGSAVSTEWQRFGALDPMASTGRGVFFTVALNPETHERIPLELLIFTETSPSEAVERIIMSHLVWRHEVIAVENNATQESFLDLLRVIRSTLHGSVPVLPLVPLFTGRNKWDPKVGLPALASKMRQGLWHLPWADIGCGEVPCICHQADCECPSCEWAQELETHPQSRGDIIMAQWFLEQIITSYEFENIDADQEETFFIPKSSELDAVF